VSGNGIINLARPFDVVVEAADSANPIPGIFGLHDENASISLRDLRAIVVSSDFNVPCGYTMKVEIHRSQHSKKEEKGLSKASSSNPVKQKRASIVKNVFNFAGSAVKGAATGVAGAVKGVADGVATAVVAGAALATGNTTNSFSHVAAKVRFQSCFQTHKLVNHSDVAPWNQIYSISVHPADLLPMAAHNPAHTLNLYMWENQVGLEKLTGTGMGGDRIIGENSIPFSKLFSDDTAETATGFKEEVIVCLLIYDYILYIVWRLNGRLCPSSDASTAVKYRCISRRSSD